MDSLKIVELKESIFEDNNKDADKLRNELNDQKTFLLNVMSSPGSGKTSILVDFIKEVKNEYKIGVLEADIDGDVDAYTIKKAGAVSVQLHTGGMCHLDADMTRQGINSIERVDIAFLENIGNLVCPAEYDTGAFKNVVILSIPEGDDKPLKYTLMFSVADIVLINKIDTKDYFSFDIEKCKENIARVNNHARVIPVSAKTGEGIDEFVLWVKEQYNQWKETL